MEQERERGGGGYNEKGAAKGGGRRESARRRERESPVAREPTRAPLVCDTWRIKAKQPLLDVTHEASVGNILACLTTFVRASTLGATTRRARGF